MQIKEANQKLKSGQDSRFPGQRRDGACAQQVEFLAPVNALVDAIHGGKPAGLVGGGRGCQRLW